jgi:hypothetical protein
MLCGVTSEDVYEDGYYEDTYEEGSVVFPVSNDGEIDSPKQMETLYGFHRNVGGGVVRITKRMVTPTYINDTALMYDCVKKADAYILVVEEPEEDEDYEEDVAKQVMDLRRRMEQVTSMASGITNGTVEVNQNTTVNVTVVKKEKEKKVSFREQQENKMRKKREQELLKEKTRPKFRVGADCEDLVCGACKSVVEEFGRAVHAVVADPQYRYIEDVIKNFCKSKSIALKYADMVSDVCVKFEQVSAFCGDAGVCVMSPLFSGFTRLQRVTRGRLRNAAGGLHLGPSQGLEQPQREEEAGVLVFTNSLTFRLIVFFCLCVQVCLEVGACSAEHFRFQTKAELRVQEQWDDKCFTCQAFARDLESKVQLSRQVTEGSIVPIVAETCNRLVRSR